MVAKKILIMVYNSLNIIRLESSPNVVPNGQLNFLLVQQQNYSSVQGYIFVIGYVFLL